MCSSKIHGILINLYMCPYVRMSMCVHPLSYCTLRLWIINKLRKAYVRYALRNYFQFLEVGYGGKVSLLSTWPWKENVRYRFYNAEGWITFTQKHASCS